MAGFYSARSSIMPPLPWPTFAPPLSNTGAKQMSRKDAHASAASLAATLMVSIVVFQAGDGTFGAVPADEIDGDEVQVVAEVDPWA